MSTFFSINQNTLIYQKHRVINTIDLNICYENWINHCIRHEKKSREEVIKASIYRYVGYRDIVHLYMEFFTHLDFPSSDKFRTFTRQVMTLGWNTLDLT